ncbi:SET domain-containing protein [Auriscalpium vulgare]|uniref:SET domain-containing protein n=1 Tax=Auriscalpium vulgare TaxID=40419 RepID=A0ACB8SBS2_9AGAM|nr:SET domain-containing protein [Auriscalpium vulgare]
MEDPDTPRYWPELLHWLEDHGMQVDAAHLLVHPRHVPGAGVGLFTMVDVSPTKALFSIPRSAQINMKTLEPHYPLGTPGSPLSATQLISLHLFLSRPADDASPSLDPLFGPYISMLPRNFNSHPLSWKVNLTLGVSGRSSIEDHLLLSLPPSVDSGLKEIEDRFWGDWKAVSAYLVRSKHFPDICPRSGRRVVVAHERNVLDYLWAWLNVNTRCVYADLGLSRSDNLSMCPVFDFANHAWTDATMTPARRSHSTWRDPSTSRESSFTCIAANVAIPKAQEVHLTYGGHPNRTLFVEYGFVTAISEETLASGVYPGEVDAQHTIEGWFRDRGHHGVWMQQLLEQEGYWGDWTLHLSPSPAHPSYRLITALRLYHLVPIDSTDLSTSHLQALLVPWRETLLGLREEVSETNEAQCRLSIVDLCEKLASEGTEAISALQAARLDDGLQVGVVWHASMLESIRMLWLEELEVARAVIRSVNTGETF